MVWHNFIRKKKNFKDYLLKKSLLKLGGQKIKGGGLWFDTFKILGVKNQGGGPMVWGGLSSSVYSTNIQCFVYNFF